MSKGHGYNANKKVSKAKAKANKKLQNSAAINHIARNDDEYDSDSVQDAESISRKDAERSNTGKFGLRKVSHGHRSWSRCAKPANF